MMSKRMIGAVLAVMVLCLGMTVHAGNAKAVRKQVESSLLLGGTIIIAPDGSVVSHTLDSTAALGDVLTKFVDGAIDKWRFEPVVVDGKVVTAKVPMSLRLVASPREDGNMDVRIASTYFGSSEKRPATSDVRRGPRLVPPQFPKGALRMGGKGTVYLILQVGPDGSVLNVDAEQVNLKVVGPERVMDELRKQFAAAAIRAGKRWTFVPPTTSPEAMKGNWLVRIPVEFRLTGDPANKSTGEWSSYVPGPRNMNMPWAREELTTAGSPDALSEGNVYDLQQGAKLLNPPAA